MMRFTFRRPRPMFCMMMFGMAAFFPMKVRSQEHISANAESRMELQVKYMGVSGDDLLFEVLLVQPTEGRSVFRIQNQDGQEILSRVVFRRNSVRRVKITKWEFDKLEFVYSNLYQELRKSFEVRLRFLEDYEVRDISRR